MTPPQVWCAIPVYNNAATVNDIATRARAQLDHLLIIDDGSTDADLQQFFPQTRDSEAPGNADVPVGTPGSFHRADEDVGVPSTHRA